MVFTVTYVIFCDINLYTMVMPPSPAPMNISNPANNTLLQESGGCYCGNDYGTYGENRHCNWYCYGSDAYTQMCGGPEHISVMYTDTTKGE